MDLMLYDNFIKKKSSASIFKAKYLKYKIKYIKLKGGMPLSELQKQKVIDYNIQDIISMDDDISDDMLDEIISNKFFEEVNTSSRAEELVVPLIRTTPGIGISSSGAEELVVPSTSTIIGDTFYIYTTGMGYTEYDETILLDLWINTLSESILLCIPDNFTKIIVEHYDPIHDQRRKQIEESINTKLHSTLLRFDRRIVSQTFFLFELPLSTIKRPHIVIDMAHVFGYYPTEENKYDAFWSGYYDHQLSISTRSFRPLNIKSIYIGFNDNQGIGNERLIRVRPDGTVRTFIDCLIDIGFYRIESDNPELSLNELREELKRKVFTMRRANGKKVDDAYIVTFIRYNLLEKILEKLFNGEPLERIRNIETYDSYPEFINQ